MPLTEEKLYGTDADGTKLVKLDQWGNKVWDKNYGGTQTEIESSLIESSNGDFILAGNTYSNDIDVSGNKGFSDYWILSLELK